MTQVTTGFGTLFATGDGGNPETFTTLAELTNVPPPSLSRDSIDASHQQSPDEWREFIPGMKDAGEISLEFNLIPGGPTMAEIVAEFSLSGSAAIKNRRVTFPDGSRWDFSAFVTGFEQGAPIDDKMAGTVTLKITGAPTFLQA